MGEASSARIMGIIVFPAIRQTGSGAVRSGGNDRLVSKRKEHTGTMVHAVIQANPLAHSGLPAP